MLQPLNKIIVYASMFIKWDQLQFPIMYVSPSSYLNIYY